MTSLRGRVGRNPVAARAAAFPVRAQLVVRHDARIVGQSIRWLIRSREHTNFTYKLTALNEEHLAWWVSTVCACPVDSARDWIRELQEDEELRLHIREKTAGSARRGLAEREVEYGRRLGWYAIARALRPQHIVETGTDKGLGSVVFAAALLRNGTGRLTTVDINPDSGYLIAGRYAEVVNRAIGYSTAVISALASSADLFLHDSLRTPEHEASEYDALSGKLASGSMVLSNHPSGALPAWAYANHRRFLYFSEDPANHWYPGSGIGASWES